MSLPTSMPLGTIRSPTGVQLQIHPSSEGRFAVELRRSTQSSTSSTAWFTQQFDPSSGAFKVSVPLPLSTRAYYWQARHVGVGYSVGAYSPVVSAKPVKLSMGGNVPIVRGKNAAVEIPLGDVWLTSAKTVKVGTQATTGAKSKSLLVPYSELVPSINTGTWRFTTAYCHGNSSTAAIMYAPIPMPENTVITGFGARLWKNAAPDTITVTFNRVNTTGGVTQLAQRIYSPGSGFLSFSTTITPETVTSTKHYVLQVSFDPNSTGADTRFYWFKVDYQMGQYDRTY